MSDILKIDGYFGRASAVLFGLTTATDNVQARTLNAAVAHSRYLVTGGLNT